MAAKKRPAPAGNLWLGICLGAWLRLLVRNRFAVDLVKWPEALLITLVAAGNSVLAGVQRLVFGRRLRGVPTPTDPVFIIGHWRSGTTMLHELLALDPRHRCPTTFESLSPNHFLLTSRWLRGVTRWLLPKRRPFDNMRVGVDRPQEDEVALALRGLGSSFLTVAFPGRPTQYPRYVDLESLSDAVRATWERGMVAFLKELLLARPGRLVLKSPQHTFRVLVLSRLFPEARFVYLVRNPWEVFPSTVHFWRTMYEQYGLQGFDEATLRERVLTTFAEMHDSVEAARRAVDPERFCEVRYETLAADPVGEVRRLYEALGLGDFEPVRPAVEQFAERSKRYKRNDYELDAADAELVATRWAGYITRHGYGELEAAP